MSDNLREFDCYITSDDIKWERRISQNLIRKEHSPYRQDMFQLGGLKLSARQKGAENCDVMIIGFRRHKNSMQLYIGAMAAEYWKEGRLVICVKVAPDAVIPKEFDVYKSLEYEADEEVLCKKLSKAINSVKSGKTTERDTPVGLDEPDYGAGPSSQDSNNSPDTTVNNSNHIREQFGNKALVLFVVISVILANLVHLFCDSIFMCLMIFVILVITFIFCYCINSIISFLKSMSRNQIFSILYFITVVVLFIIFGKGSLILTVPFIKFAYDILMKFFSE